MCVYVYMDVCADVHVYVLACACVCLYACVWLYGSMCTRTYVYVCVRAHVYRHHRWNTGLNYVFALLAYRKHIIVNTNQEAARPSNVWSSFCRMLSSCGSVASAATVVIFKLNIYSYQVDSEFKPPWSPWPSPDIHPIEALKVTQTKTRTGGKTTRTCFEDISHAPYPQLQMLHGVDMHAHQDAGQRQSKSQ